MKKLTTLSAIIYASFVLAACDDGSIYGDIDDYCEHSVYCGNHPDERHKIDQCVDELDRRYREFPECDWRLSDLLHCGSYYRNTCGPVEPKELKCVGERNCAGGYWQRECRSENEALADCMDGYRRR